MTLAIGLSLAGLILIYPQHICGLILIYLQKNCWFDHLSLSSEWGFTFFSIGVDIAVTYLIIDQLLLRDKRRSWKAVEELANKHIGDQLTEVFHLLYIITCSGSIAPGVHKEKEILEGMRKLSDPASVAELQKNLAKLKIFQARGRKVPDIISSLTGDCAERLGDLQLRYSSQFLDPKLVRLIAEVENHLRHLGILISSFRRIVASSKVSNVSGFEKAIAKSDIQPLLKTFVEAVDDHVYELQSLSIG
jgi:hypothetical protein